MQVKRRRVRRTIERRKVRREQKRAERGSQRWLQRYVEHCPAALDEAIGLGPLEWLSPLANDAFAEYQDQAFLDRLGIVLPTRSLQSFWPTRGPVWDGLAHAADGTCILVEARAHTAELASTCGATAATSLLAITSAFTEVKRTLGVDPDSDWLTGYYQYANGLAHAYLLSEANGISTRLVFLYFTGGADMAGPRSQDEWEVQAATVCEALGLVDRLPEYVSNAYLEAGRAG